MIRTTLLSSKRSVSLINLSASASLASASRAMGTAASSPLASPPSAEKLEIASLVARSRAAQAKIENYTQAQVDQLCKVYMVYIYIYIR